MFVADFDKAFRLLKEIQLLYVGTDVEVRLDVLSYGYNIVIDGYELSIFDSNKREIYINSRNRKKLEQFLKQYMKDNKVEIYKLTKL